MADLGESGWNGIRPLEIRPETAVGAEGIVPAWPFDHAKGTPEAGAYFSADWKYRYLLWRHWDEKNAYKCAFILLNSSTADHIKNDPTVARCIDFAKRWGYGGAYWMNLFAIRSYDPSVLKIDVDPVGPENDRILREMTHHPLVRMVILGCGALGNIGGRFDKVLKLLPENCYCLGLTKAGLPRAPSLPEGNDGLIFVRALRNLSIVRVGENG